MTGRSCLLAALVVAGAARAEDGHALLSRARAQNGFAAWRERKSDVVLETSSDDAGRRAEATVYERAEPGAEHRTLIVFTAPDSLRGMRMLHVAPPLAPDEYWIRYPSTRRARRLGGNAAGWRHHDEIFSGTDLSYRDVELLVRVLQWGEGEATATAEDASCEGRPCAKVTLVPSARIELPFARYVLWLGRDDLLLGRAELFADDGTLVETIACDGYHPVGRFQTPARCVVENAKTGVRATMTFRDVAYDSGLDDGLFTVSGVEQGP